MSLDSSRCNLPSGSVADDRREKLSQWLTEAGCYRYGVARAGIVDPAAMQSYDEWIARGYHGDMAYLARYGDVRRDPAMLLDGARSVIVCAFPYYSPLTRAKGAVKFARYAVGDDYHEVLRRRLTPVADKISEQWGETTRICIDTAPLPERYWAVRSGLGFVGVNRQLIIPHAGSYFFLATLVTTLELTPDEPCRMSCGSCGKCVHWCPGKALTPDGLDARKCNSYLTIEYRGETLPDNVNLGDRIYGCDICADVCPHNRRPPVTTIEEFMPRPALMELTREDIAAMTQEEFSTIFRRSAVKRTKLSGLQRNAAHEQKLDIFDN